MAESSGFFRSVGGDRKYTVDFLAQWVASFLSSGVYADDLAVTAGENMQIVLPAGRAWINGYYYRNDSALALPLENADGVLNRRDTVVLRWDVNERTITAQVLTGTPASNPEAPAITRTAEQYDLKLAEISIPAGTTSTTQALITDTRMNDSVCGIVTGVVAQVDTTTFYNQIAADLAEFKSSNEAGFTAWANGLKDVLNESAAGNLLNLINQRAYTTLSCTKSGTVYALTGLTATSGTVPVTFKATAAYAAGDTVTIDGTAYALATRDGSALTSGAWAAGAIITGVADVDAKALTVEPSSPVGALPLHGVVNNSSDSLNNYFTDGRWYVQNAENLPNGKPGYLDVCTGYSGNYAKQEFTEYSGQKYFRVLNAGAWMDWLTSSVRLPNIYSGAIFDKIASAVSAGYTDFEFGVSGTADAAVTDTPLLSNGNHDQWGLVTYKKQGSSFAIITFIGEGDRSIFRRTMAGGAWKDDWHLANGIVILPHKDSAIPAGLADNTLVFRLDVTSS